jgi:hypothetical protein
MDVCNAEAEREFSRMNIHHAVQGKHLVRGIYIIEKNGSEEFSWMNIDH